MLEFSTKAMGKHKKSKLRTESLILRFFLILIYLTHSLLHTLAIKSNEQKDPEQSVARAMIDVIHKFYIPYNIKFYVIIYGQTTNHINDILDIITKDLFKNIAVNLMQVEYIEDLDHSFSDSAVIFTKSIGNLLYFHEECLKAERNILSSQPKRFKFVIYTEEVTTFKQIQLIVNQKSEEYNIQTIDVRFHELFIINDRKMVNLVANLLYSYGNCGRFSPKLVNSFNKVNQKWTKKLQNYNHFANFHGCTLHILGYYGPHLYPKYNVLSLNYVTLVIDRSKKLLVAANKDTTFYGLNYELIKMMSRRSNFSPHFSLLHDEIIKLGNNTIGMVASKNFVPHPSSSVLIANDVKKIASLGSHHFSYGEKNNYFLLSPNDLYTNYEKLFFAFDRATWMMILFTYGLSFVIIAVLRITSRKIISIVFGRDVNRPAFNLLGAFFGISQLRMPNENFSRSVWLVYIWFSLMIRTCYQSKLFEFMTSDMRHPLPETMEDFVKYNYTTIIPENGLNDLKTSLRTIWFTGKRPRTWLMPTQDFRSTYEKVLNDESNEKFAFFVDEMIHSQFNMTFEKSLPIMNRLPVKETLNINVGMNGILYSQLEYFMRRLVPAGIPKHLYDYGKWFLYRPIDVEVEDPRKVLTLSILEFGFVLYLGAILVSTLVFFGEQISFWFLSKVGKTVGLIDFLRVLRGRLNNYHDRW